MTNTSGRALVLRVALNISAFRRARGWTQEQFAERVGVTVQWVSHCEAGQNLTLASIAKLAHVLGIDPLELFRPSLEVVAKKISRGRPRKKPPAC